MDTHLAARRNRTLVALVGGLVLIAGVAPFRAALADDDNWHAEAERPLTIQQQIRDRDMVLASIAAAPEREVVYGAPSARSVAPPEQYIDSAYQTAGVDRPH
jgi:hypothetical protein